MNSNEYIASGILEEYVLGQLTADQRAEVEAMAAQYPEIRAELKTIEEALAKYSMVHARPMSAELKQKILQRVAALESGKTTDAKTPSAPLRNLLGWIVGLLALLAIAVWSFIQNQKLERNLEEVQQQMESNMAHCDSIRIKNDQLEQQLSILKNPGLQLVFMEGTAKSKTSQVVVHYNPVLAQAYLRVDDLPQPAPGKQYQLWAIVAGAPVSMGVFDIPADSSALISVSFVADAQAFAVTLEKTGGVASPTLEDMYVIGNVGG